MISKRIIIADTVKFGAILLFMLSSVLGYSQLPTLEVNHDYSKNLVNEFLVYGPVSKDAKLSEIRDLDFVSPDSLHEVSTQGIYWTRFEIKCNSDETIILDFNRIDHIDVYYDELQQTNHFQTGYLLPASKKQMGKWNTIKLRLKAGSTYTIYSRLENTAHLTDFNIHLKSDLTWVKENSTKLIQDVGFLGIIGILTLYNFIIFLFGREKGYLYLSLYLFSVFLFFIFSSGLLRDFIVPEYPGHTLIFITSILLAPIFYYGFMVEFLDTKRLIPKWDKILKGLVRVDITIFLGAVLIFIITNNYQLASKISQITLLVNITAAYIAIFLLYKNRDSLAMYFIFGTLVMAIGATVDIILWDSKARLGDVSRIGFVIEIIFFSIGLGKKIQHIEKERQRAQMSYIEQLEINEKLVDKQNQILERQVSARTKELEEAKNSAEAATKMKSDFLSVMSHEIRTPMNAVIGMIHLLMDNKPGAHQKDNLKTLKFSAENLLVLMNDILDFNKIESGKLTLESVPFNLKMLTSGIQEVYSVRAESKDIQFEILLDKKLPPSVIGDPGRLTQILNNLISNAIKFTHQGKVEVRIDLVKKSHFSAKLEFSVKDSGIGISQDKQLIIFESFTQAQTDTSRQFGGTGLGLAITKSILELFSSEIHLNSQEGLGSRFYFQLELPIDRSSSRTKPEEDKNEKLKVIKGKKILIVDDNIVNLMMTSSFFKNWKVNSVLAKSGEEALDKITAHSFNLVLLDLQMPEMDGYEVARKIRKLGIEIPIIALSADTLSHADEGVIAAGMNDFIAKPFQPDELINIVYNYTKKNFKIDQE